MNVAKRKVDIVRGELTRYKIALHTLTNRDKVIVVTDGLISLASGTAIGVEVFPPVSVEVTNMELSHAVAPGDDVTIQPGRGCPIHDLLNGNV